MEHEFPTPRPILLVVHGRDVDVRLVACDTERTVVTGADPHRPEDAPEVSHEGDVVRVVYPDASRGWRRRERLDLTVTLPADSDLELRLGSGDLSANGRYRDIRLDGGSGDLGIDECRELVATVGSGDLAVGVVHRRCDVKQGSGDTTVRALEGDSQVFSGSGDVRVDNLAGGELSARSGSGDIELGAVRGGTATVKTGSGDFLVRRAESGEVAATTGSGDVVVRVPEGTPVWADVVSASGDLDSRVRGGGQPAEGEPYVAVRVRTASGDISLVPA